MRARGSFGALVLRALIFLIVLVGAAACGDLLDLGEYTLCGAGGAGGCPGSLSDAGERG
jgi:hypothetical protein